MTDVALRAVREDEAGVVLDLWVRAGENAARPADEPDAVVRLVAHDPEALVVAEVDGLVVGTVIAGWDGWRADRYRLAVDPDVRGRVIGGLLLARAEQHLRTLGAARFCAMVLEDDDLGRESWTSRGYEPQDDWRRWVEAASS